MDDHQVNMNPLTTTNPRDEPPARPGRLQRVLHTLLAVGIALIGFTVMLAALVMGTVLALGLVVWALIRGRKPAAGVFRSTYQRARERQSNMRRAEVVDVEVREVVEPGAK